MLGIDFLEKVILNAVTKHPRRRNIVFVAPSGYYPPQGAQSIFLGEWYRKNLSHQIRFDHSTKIIFQEGRRVVVTKGPVENGRVSFSFVDSICFSR